MRSSKSIFKVRLEKMYKYFIKRILDLFIVLIVLPIFAIVYVAVAPIVHFTDGGPVFYCGERIGRNGRLFKMYKFRSMRVNAPDIRLSDGSTYNGEDDPRVTKIGKILRATSIDEIPQILNVLKGDMSLIGPRPDPPDWLERYSEDIKIFLTVRPGITGYSQAYFRNSADGEQKMQNDAFYATHCTFRMDLKIFFKSIAVVLLHENTYKDTTNETDAKAEAAKEAKERNMVSTK